MSDWRYISTAPEGVSVLTKIHDGKGARNEQIMVKRTREPGKTRPMWWLEDGSMYVYYEPTHWQPLSKAKPPQNRGTTDGNDT